MNEHTGSKLLNENKVNNNYSNQPNGKLTTYLCICLTTVCFGTGFDYGWTFGLFNSPSPVIKQFYSDVYLERYNQSISESKLNSLWSITNGGVLFGGIFGGLISGVVADYFGRKKSILLVNLFIIIRTILITTSKFIKSYEATIIARFISGLICGLFTGILPIYVNEISPENLRGFVGTLNQVLAVLAKLSVNIVGLPNFLGTSDKWPVLVSFLIVPSLTHFFFIFLDESPKYLFIQKNDKKAAEIILRKLRNNDMILVEYEIKQLTIEKKQTKQNNDIKWKDFLVEKHLRRPLIITIIIQCAQNLTGIDAIVFYSTDIFENIGLKGNWPTYATVLLSLVQLFMTIISMMIVDKAGRKSLMVIGMIGISLSSFFLALFRFLGEKNPDKLWYNYMTVVCAVSYMMFWSIGPSTIPWIITSELFASNSRGKATSIAVFINWFSAFIVASSFPFIEVAIRSFSFIIFGLITIVSAIYIIFYVPETKSKSIEELINIFKH